MLNNAVLHLLHSVCKYIKKMQNFTTHLLKAGNLMSDFSSAGCPAAVADLTLLVYPLSAVVTPGVLLPSTGQSLSDRLNPPGRR
jgi:hypothetical protein